MRIIFILFFVLASTSFGANEASQTFTLDGQLFHVGTTSPLIDSSAQLKVQILDPSQTCVLYEETQSVNTSNTEGFFNIQVGSLPGSGKRTGLDAGLTMSSVIQNVAAVSASSAPGQTCASSIYTPAPGDTRYFRITVIPSSGSPDVLSPDMVLDSVPSALVAQSVEGLDKSNILHTNTTSPAGEVLTQANLESLFTPTAYANLAPILAGNYVQSGTGGANLPTFAANPGAPAAGDIWYNSTTQNLVYSDGSTSHVLGVAGSGLSSLTVTARLTANGVAGGTLNAPGTIDLNTAGTAGTYVKVTTDAYGRVTGNSLLAEADIPTLVTPGKVSGAAINTGAIAGNASVNTTGNIQTTNDMTANRYFIYDHAGVGPNYVGMTAPANMTSAGGASYTMVWPDRKGSANQVLTTDGSGNLSWAAPTSGAYVLKAGDTMTGPLVNNSNSASTAVAVTQAGAGYAATFMGGNVGIGITSPLTPLHVFTSVNTPAVKVEGIFSGGYSQMNLKGTGGEFGIGVGNAGETSFGVANKFFIFDNSSIAMRAVIDSNGNLGIGTTAPSSILDINGAQTIEETAAASKPVAAAGKDFIYADNTSHTLKVSLNGGAYTDLLTATSGSAYVLKAGDTMTGPLVNNSNSASTALAVTQSGAGHAATFMGGGVGIGTTTPAAILSNSSSLNVDSAGSSVMTSGLDWIGNGGGYAAGFYNNAPGAGGNGLLVKVSGNTSSNVAFAIDQAVTENGAGSALFRVLGNGNVGIGNSAPGYLLDLGPSTGGEISMSGDGATDANMKLMWNSAERLGMTGNGLATWGVGAAPGFGAIRFGYAPFSYISGGPSSSLLLNPTSGNVGIGTNSPSSTLDINGAQTIEETASGSAPTAAAGKDFIYADNSSHTLKVSLNGGPYVDLATSGTTGAYVLKAGDTMTGPLVNNSNSASTALVVTQAGTGYAATFMGGGVGIGTTTPGSTKLYISDNSSIGGYYANPLHLFNSNGASSAFDITLWHQANGSGSIIDGDALVQNGIGNLVLSAGVAGKDLKFIGGSSANSPSMIIKDGGNVGVGTTSPSSILDINGAQTVREIANASAPAAAAGKDFIYADNASHTLKVSLNGGAYTDIATTATTGAYVLKAGDTMTGPLVNNSNSASTALAVTQSGSGYAASFVGGNVGVNQAAPLYTLDVGNAGTGSQNIRINSNSDDQGIYFANAGGNRFKIYQSQTSLIFGSQDTNAGETFMFSGGTMDGSTGTHSTQLFRVDGTWNQPLDVLYGIRLNLTDTASAAGSKLFDLERNSSSVFNVDKNGSVGIGVPTPLATLDLNGSQAVREIASASAPAAAAGKDFIYADNVSHTLKVSLNGGAYVDIATGGGAGSYVLKAGDTMTGPLVNNTSSASTALAIAQSGAGYAATFTGGSVGIGTTAPTAALEVVGTFSTSGDSHISSGGYSGNNYYVNSGSSYGGVVQCPNGQQYVVSDNGDSCGSLNYTGSATIVVACNGSQGAGGHHVDCGSYGGNGLFVSGTSQKVGIGTTSPASILDINGAQTIEEIASASKPVAAAGKDFIYADNVSHTLKLSANGGAYSNILTAAGGTMTGLLVLSADPSNVLGAATKQYVDAATGGGTYVAKAGDTMTGALVNNTNSASTALAVTQSGSGYAATLMGGSVGVGTTSPGAALDIVTGAATPLSFAARSNPGGTGAGYPNAIVFENLAPGNYKNQFSLRGGGAERWSLGNDAFGVGSQNFYIYDGNTTHIPFAINSDDVIQTLSTGVWGFSTSSSLPIGTVADTGISRISANEIGVGNGTSGDYSGTLAAANVAIGQSTAGYPLDVNGSARATAFLYTSDRRLKKDITPIENPLDKLLALEGVHFLWKNTGEPTVGFIAQDVEKVIPEVVKTDVKTSYKSVQYGNIVAMVVEAVKEFFYNQQKVNGEVEARLTALEKQNAELLELVKKQNKLLEEIKRAPASQEVK